jgi:hypothetical protein
VSELARLHPHDLQVLAELVAVRLAELIAERQTPDAGLLVTAVDIARRFGMTAEWVREHGAELGGFRLGSGSRPRWRFDPQRVAEALEQRAACAPGRGSGPPDLPAPAQEPARRRRPAPTRARLLPIRGREG